MEQSSQVRPTRRAAWLGAGTDQPRLNLGEGGQRKVRTADPGGGRGTGGAEGLTPTPTPPHSAGRSGPWASGLAFAPFCLSVGRESQLPETISIFIFLGNFTAFISGKIKAVIAGEMIPIRA